MPTPSSHPSINFDKYAAQFKIGKWRLTPETIEPAFVLIQNRETPISTIFIDDSPNENQENLFQIPLAEVKDYFEICDGDSLFETLKTAFHQTQKYLIDNELPMQGPLVYLRVGWLIFYKNLSCKKALETNLQIEDWMRSWIKDSISGLTDVPPWIATGSH